MTPAGSAGWALRFHEQLVQCLASGERLALATVVGGRGSRPRQPGARMFVREDGSAVGTIGGGALEGAVMADCRSILAEGGTALKTYDLAESGENSVGMTCGGGVDLFLEVLEPPARLCIFGAGHVGRSVAAVMASCGLSMTVVDDRADWLVPGAFPEGVSLHRCTRDHAGDLPALNASDSVVVVTRCHATDLNVLRTLQDRPLRYLGLIGSRRKVTKVVKELREAGASEDWLSTIHGPIGLPIGAETPGEIGVAIAAQIVSVLRRAEP